jgi:hypothetical protein
MERHQLAVGSWVRITKSSEDSDWIRSMDEYNRDESVITCIDEDWCRLSINGQRLWWNRLSLTLISQDTSLIKPWSRVRLGSHDWVSGSRDWDPEMEYFVGKETTVKTVSTLDGFKVAMVGVDAGRFYWRLCSMTLVK